MTNTTKTRAGIACATALALLMTGSSAGAQNRSGRGAVSDMLRVALGRFPDFAALPDSLGLDAPVILHGTLTDLTGSPMSGAEVLLAAWPTTDSIDALPIGGTFPIAPVARTVAGSDGTYELRSALTPQLASLTTKVGLDVKLNVFHGGRHHVYLSQVVPDRSIGGWVYQLGADSPTESPSVKANSRNALDVALDPRNSQKLSRELFQAPLTLPGGPRPPAPPACSNYEKISEHEAWTTVATALVRNGTSVKVEYAETAESAISTGASTDGVHFSVSGTRSEISGRGAMWTDTAERGGRLNTEYQALWLHATEQRLCAADMTGKHYDPAYQTSPLRSKGGAQPVKAGKQNPLWTCTDKNSVAGNADDVWTDNQRAKTYEAAFGLTPTDRGSLIGSARSGYSKSVKITFSFPHRDRGYWCGDSSDPGADGQRLQGGQVNKGQRVPGTPR